jgi:UDP-N-acetylmuramoyl-tripeptide--D-alanyl-D-alanine ligase
MTFLSLEEMRTAVGGTWLVPPDDATHQPRGVSIDTRGAIEDAVYIALVGERHDGHDFLPQAVEGKAAAVIVEPARLRSSHPRTTPMIAVEDTTRALWSLAEAWRPRLEATVVGITGSAGKTTVRRLLQGVCEAAGPTTASIRSFNNDIGLPLTILSARPDDAYLLVEIGTNAPGEIRALSTLAAPDVGVITSIGRAHLEGLGSLEGIAREKGALIEALPASGVAIVPAESGPLAPLLPDLLPDGARLVSFGGTEPPRGLRDRKALGCSGMQILTFMDGQELRVQLAGAHNALNACAAVEAARALQIPDSTIFPAITTVEPDAMRLAPRLMESTGTMLLNDVYNSNPDAVRAALETFAEIATDAPRRVVILGDMLELGSDENALHAEVGRGVARLHERIPVDVAIFIGERSAHSAKALQEAGFENLLVTMPRLDDCLAETVASVVMDGDAVLAKASRGMAFERIIDAIHERGARSTGELASH